MRLRLLFVLAALAALTACTAAPGPEAPAQGVSAPVSSEAAAPAALLAPARVDVPAIGASSTLVPLGLNADDTVAVPPVEQPEQAGWYRLGVTPGDAGPAVILGHINGGGRPGVFARLAELERGDEVLVTRQDGADVRFVIDRVEAFGKERFPTREVYGDTENAEVRIVSCGGEFDRAAGSYEDNVIAFGHREGGTA